MYGASALYLAAQGGHHAACVALVEAGAAVDAALTQMGVTPLFVAAERGSLAITNLLLSHGAATEARNWNGVTPLHMAAMRGHLEVVRALRTAAASLDTASNEGATPLLSVAAGEEPLEAAPRRAMATSTVTDSGHARFRPPAPRAPLGDS